MKYRAFRKDGTEVQENDKLIDFRKDEWKFISVTHPRKVYVIDETGWKQEYYANVFDLGIKDESDNWTFSL